MRDFLSRTSSSPEHEVLSYERQRVAVGFEATVVAALLLFDLKRGKRKKSPKRIFLGGEYIVVGGVGDCGCQLPDGRIQSVQRFDLSYHATLNVAQE